MIYLSYVQTDNAFIQQLTDSLKQSGHSITTDINTATTVIVCLSPDYDTSRIPSTDALLIHIMIRPIDRPPGLADEPLIDFTSYDAGLEKLLSLLSTEKKERRKTSGKLMQAVEDEEAVEDEYIREITFDDVDQFEGDFENNERAQNDERAQNNERTKEEREEAEPEPTYFGGVIPEAEPSEPESVAREEALPPTPKPVPAAPAAPAPQVSQPSQPAAEVGSTPLARGRQDMFGIQDLLEPPEFTAFYPQAVQPARTYALMVFMHLPAAIKQVEQIAKGFAGLMGDRPTSSRTSSRIQIEVGNLITIVLKLDGLPIQQQTLIWEMPQQNVTFPFITPATLTDELKGHVIIYQGPLVIGEIAITMTALAALKSVDTGLKEQGTFQRYDPIFASYSHKDTPIMEYFRKERERIGVKMLVDIYDLRAGDHWEKRLYDMIDESAVFQLFWSKNSAISPYCRDEWQHALQYDGTRPRFIQPVYWEGKGPNPFPPPELGHIHFQPVVVPALTRFQLITARLKGLFKSR